MGAINLRIDDVVTLKVAYVSQERSWTACFLLKRTIFQLELGVPRTLWPAVP